MAMDEKSLSESPENRGASWQEMSVSQVNDEYRDWRSRMAAWAKDHMDIRSLPPSV